MGRGPTLPPVGFIGFRVQYTCHVISIREKTASPAPRPATRNFSCNNSKRMVDWGRAILEGGGWLRGCTGAKMTFTTRHTTTWTDRSALQVRLMALSVPSDCNRSPRGASAGLLPWKERPGRCGRGAQAVGRDPPGHQRPVVAIDEPRSARPMDTSSTSRGCCGGGEGHGLGGQWVDMRGVLSGFGATRAKM